jgi:hypothetical protein
MNSFTIANTSECGVTANMSGLGPDDSGFESRHSDHYMPHTGEIWQHYKTKGEYEIVGIGQLQVKTEDLDMKDCVVYKALSDGKLWCRPMEDFLETVENEAGEQAPRFSKVK